MDRSKAKSLRISMRIISNPDYYVDLKDISLGPTLGSGAFSTVYIGRYFGDLVAVKKQVRDAEAIEKYLAQELTVLSHLKDAHNENLISYIGACNNTITDNDKQLFELYIVTDYCQGGDLLPVILDKQHKLGWKFIIKLACQAANAVCHLHDNNIIHRDIKSSNFLLDHNWNLKLTDFGMSRIVSDPFINSRMTICGTNEYMAPEMLFQEEYNAAIDIFSLGMVFLEMMARKRVGRDDFMERKPQKNFEIDIEEAKTHLPEDAPQSFVILSQQCIEYDSNMRPISEEVQDWLLDLSKDIHDDDLPLPPLRDCPPGFDINAPGTNHNSLFSAPGSPIKPSASYRQSDSQISTSSTSTPTANTTNTTTATSTTTTTTTPVPPPSTQTQKTKEKTTIPMISPLPTTTTRFSASPQNLNFMTTPCLTARMEGGRLDTDRNPDRVRRAGMLHKRNSTGFRNWKKVEFTLYRTRLSWKSEADKEIKNLYLKGATVIKNKSYRFEIIVPSDEKNPNILLNKELAADSSAAQDAWIKDIKEAIAAANKEADEAHEQSEMTRFAKQNPLRKFQNTTQWLESIHLPEYIDAFVKHNYEYHMLCEMGLKESDLDFLKIVSPLHRSMLIASTKPAYSDFVRIVLTSVRQFDSVTVYSVVSRYRFFRSSLLLRFTDFRKFDSRIRLLFKNEQAILDTFPSLPSSGLNRSLLDTNDDIIWDKVPSEERLKSFENYLNNMAVALQKTPHFRSILEFLDLI